MSREFSIRIAPELAGWVCRHGSPGRVIGAVATAAHRGLLRVNVPDPGPGPERVTVRVPERALPLIRELTHSRDSLVALRKLILAGYQARALPSAGVSMKTLPEVSSAILAPRGRYDPQDGLWHGTGTLCGPSECSVALEPESNLLPLRENAPAGLLGFLDVHPVIESIMFAAIPVVLLGLLWLFSRAEKADNAVAQPIAETAAEVVRDGAWIPATVSRLAKLVW